MVLYHHVITRTSDGEKVRTSSNVALNSPERYQKISCLMTPGRRNLRAVSSGVRNEPIDAKFELHDPPGHGRWLRKAQHGLSAFPRGENVTFSSQGIILIKMKQICCRADS